MVQDEQRPCPLEMDPLPDLDRGPFDLPQLWFKLGRVSLARAHFGLNWGIGGYFGGKETQVQIVQKPQLQLVC